MRNIIIKSAASTLESDGDNYALLSLAPGGYIVAGTELVRLYLRMPDGNALMIAGSEFISKGFDGFAFEFTAHPEFPGLAARVEVRAENGFFYFRPSVSEIPEDWYLELMDVVNPHVPNSGKVLVPFSEGMLCQTPAEHDLAPDPKPAHVTNYYRYPGVVQMQFLAFCSDSGGGIYFGAHDPEHAPKRVLFHGQDSRELILSTYCAAQKTYESPFEYVLGVFEGDWMDAAMIYRDWVHAEGKLKRNEPAWMTESPVIVTYSVCGEGPISGKTNEYIPYKNALPHLLNIAEKTDGKIMALPLRWDQYGPWLPPYVWPPRGGEASLAELRDELHARGHLLGLYGSGISFTTKSLTTDYQADATPFENDLARNVDGTLMKSDEAGLRESILFCPCCKSGRDIAKEQTRMIAEFGVDFFQLFDQNLGGSHIYSCYGKTHKHPSVPGRHETKGWNSLFREINDMLKKMASPMLIGTECAAAHPHINELPLNDLRPQLAWGFGGTGSPVPLYQFVFHEYLNNFSGNQCMANQYDLEKSPENLLWRMAYGFNSGALLTIPMRGKGEIDWGAAMDWKLPPPDKEQVLTLVRNLNAMRKQYPQFLRYGKMLKPLLALRGGTYELYLKTRVEILDSFLHSSWEATDGKKAQIITNFLPKTQKALCTPPASSICVINGEKRSGSFEIEVPPLSAIILHVK